MRPIVARASVGAQIASASYRKKKKEDGGGSGQRGMIRVWPKLSEVYL